MENKDKKLEAFERALDVMDRLRAECPWNHAQTIDTLRPMTIEEVYELSDAVLKKDAKALEKMVKEIVPNVPITIAMHEPFSGSHVGPGMLGLFFYGKER